MKANKAFIYASILAYFGCLLVTLMGKPAIVGLDPVQQMIFYVLLIFLLSCYLVAPNSNIPKYILGGFYGVGAMLAFSGFVVWAPGSVVTGPAMAFWDLVLAVSILTYEEDIER